MNGKKLRKILTLAIMIAMIISSIPMVIGKPVEETTGTGDDDDDDLETGDYVIGIIFDYRFSFGFYGGNELCFGVSDGNGFDLNTPYVSYSHDIVCMGEVFQGHTIQGGMVFLEVRLTAVLLEVIIIGDDDGGSVIKDVTLPSNKQVKAVILPNPKAINLEEPVNIEIPISLDEPMILPEPVEVIDNPIPIDPEPVSGNDIEPAADQQTSPEGNQQVIQSLTTTTETADDDDDYDPEEDRDDINYWYRIFAFNDPGVTIQGLDSEGMGNLHASVSYQHLYDKLVNRKEAGVCVPCEVLANNYHSFEIDTNFYPLGSHQIEKYCDHRLNSYYNSPPGGGEAGHSAYQYVMSEFDLINHYIPYGDPDENYADDDDDEKDNQNDPAEEKPDEPEVPDNEFSITNILASFRNNEITIFEAIQRIIEIILEKLIPA
jgi:hypothetical protein